MMRLLFAVILCLKIVSSEEYLEVNITQGPVRGYKSTEGIFVFYGIPYATTPTGPNKFQAPLPPPTWETLFEATESLIACPQIWSALPLNNNITVKEECLITNIYVPDTEEKDLPVVVYFHGGAYQFGFGETMSPKQLVKSKKVIAVNFNYRLGANGFLCLGTKDAPGNAGMKDQVALLRWVQENIGYFGGDPDAVTISGCSAGGVSVDLHIFSKMSTGLFSKVIAESGSCVSSFSIQVDPIENARAYAKLLNFDNVDNKEKLEDFYKNASLSLLTSIEEFIRPDASILFTPCIEQDVGQEMFLDNIPFKTGVYQQVPMLYGLTDMEVIPTVHLFDKFKELMNENFSVFLPVNLDFKTEKERKKAAETIKKFYFGNRTVDENSALNFVAYLTDTVFAYSTLKSVELHTTAGNDQIFLYEYSFDKNGNYSLEYIDLPGAKHCEQSIAILDEINEDDLSKEYKNMKAVLRELWLNFITTGTPVPPESSYPQWPPVRKNASPYMSLNSTLELRDKLKHKIVKFWDKIYSNYYRKPIPPTF